MPSRFMDQQKEVDVVGHDDEAIHRYAFIGAPHVGDGVCHLLPDGCQVCFREGAEALPYDI